MKTLTALGILTGVATIILEIPLIVVLGALGIGFILSGDNNIRISQNQLQRLLDENRY